MKVNLAEPNYTIQYQTQPYYTSPNEYETLPNLTMQHSTPLYQTQQDPNEY